MADAKYTPRLRTLYTGSIREKLTQQFGYSNGMQIPALDKVVINMGVGEAVADSKKIRSAVADLAAITGQKPIETKSRKSIATFKLRDGMTIGAKVTLRRERMYEFVDRLTTIALPRVKDFRGLNAQVFRRPWQLRDGPQGTHRVPGDQLRQHRDGLGHGHHCVHDGAHQRRSESTPHGVRLSLPYLGALERNDMAKKSSIEKNNRRKRLMEQYAEEAR